MGSAKDIKEAKAFKRFSKKHPKRIFRRILKQQNQTIRKIELRKGKLKPSVKRNIKKSLVRKRMMRRMSLLDNIRNPKRRNVPFWKRGGRTIYGFKPSSRRGRNRNPFYRQRRQRRGKVIN